MDKPVHEKIEELNRRIQELTRQHALTGRQLAQLIEELHDLKRAINISSAEIPGQQIEPTIIESVEVREVIEAPHHQPPPPPGPPQKVAVRPSAPRSSSSFEEFIGKNLASKVGILVTIIGIFIGAKYAIEHEMISPVVRVIAGYVCGAALIAVAAWLKNKYEAYSSVLMGGGLAVLYFITYIAYSFYGLMPQLAAFGLMLVFTAGTVYAALLYNRVIIAHLAQVGAYAIPFLLSDNSGRYAIFFAYMAVINTGILAVSLRKYWKSLFYSAFALTWIIFFSWYFFGFAYNLHKYIAWTYLSIFFLIFYATFLAYKIIKKENYELHDVFVLLSNAFIFYGVGYSLMQHEPASNYAGLFTLINAALHLVVSQVIRRMQLADRSLYYLILGLVIVFCTIAVPVQLDGNWVTLLWTTEAVLVFLIGRMRKAPAYEKLGAALAILSFLSFVQDSARHSFDFTYAYRGTVRPFMNIVFATGLLVAAAQAVMIYYNRNKKYESMLPATGLFRWFYDSALLAMFIVTSYFVFVIEIHGYFKLLEKPGAVYDTFYGIWNTRISAFAFVVTLLYSMAFDIVLMVINLRWGRSKALAGFSLTAIVIMTVLLITEALPVLNELTTTWFQKEGGYFGALEFLIRYVVVAFTAILLYAGNQARAAFIPDGWLQKAWPLLVHAITLSFLSAEYLCWANSSGSDNQYKLGLSILWGIYALGLVVLGIRKKQKHLRLAGIVLFSITLIKLFLYDLAGSGTITKTVSFISLGVLLLVVSFLYNKYKEVLFGEPDARKSDS